MQDPTHHGDADDGEHDDHDADVLGSGERDLDDAVPAGAASRRVPDPMDRVWRHPSEIGAARPRAAAPAPRGARARSRAGVWPLTLVAAAAGSLVTVAVLAAAGAIGHDTRATVAAAARPNPGPSDASVVRAAASVQPAVVGILARDATGARRGSGVCIRHGAEIVTAASVVGSARTVVVTSPDGTTGTGTVVGRDPASGVALVRLTADLTVARLAGTVPATGAKISIVAAGFLELSTVTGHDVWLADASGVTMRGLIGTSAVGSTSTGGAVVDDTGAVAGVIVAADGTAIPIGYAEDVLEALRVDGRVDHGWVGISGTDRDGEAVVTGVTPASPGAGAGIAPGDVIARADSHPVASMAEVMAAVRSRWPGQTVRLEVQHGQTARELDVVVASEPEARPPHVLLVHNL